MMAMFAGARQYGAGDGHGVLVRLAAQRLTDLFADVQHIFQREAAEHIAGRRYDDNTRLRIEHGIFRRSRRAQSALIQLRHTLGDAGLGRDMATRVDGVDDRSTESHPMIVLPAVPRQAARV